jgi:hypothetical protein
MGILKKQPETEMEYWKAIEGLGGYIWSTNHGLSRYHIEDPDGKISKHLREVSEEIQGLSREITEKFGIILPVDYPVIAFNKELPKAPEGKRYYWDWYREMKKSYSQKEYDGIICSACPFTEGVEYMIALGGQIPCGAVQGSINRLRFPFMCGMTGWSDSWTEDQLKEEIIKKGGEQAYAVFLAKKAEIQNNFVPT